MKCEEVWEKGPIVSKYCFEKNAFNYEYFRRCEKKGLIIIEKNTLQKFIL